MKIFSIFFMYGFLAYAKNILILYNEFELFNNTDRFCIN